MGAVLEKLTQKPIDNADAAALYNAFRAEYELIAGPASSKNGASSQVLAMLHQELVRKPVELRRLAVQLGNSHRVDDTVVQALGAALKKRAAVVQLSLRSTAVTHIGIEALIVNAGCLTALDLSTNHSIGDKGVEIIARWIADRPGVAAGGSRLEQLYLRDTRCGEVGVAALADALSAGLGTGLCLRILDISENVVTPAAHERLVACTKAYPRLGRLLLDGNHSVAPSKDVRDALAETMLRNAAVTDTIEMLVSACYHRRFKKRMTVIQKSLRGKFPVGADGSGAAPGDGTGSLGFAGARRGPTARARSMMRQPLYGHANAAPDYGLFTPSERFRIGSAEMRGRRPGMEDVSMVIGGFMGQPRCDFVAVFDGHGGLKAATYVAHALHPAVAQKLTEGLQPVQALSAAFREVHSGMLSWAQYLGTTACVALIIDTTLFIANCGDTRAVLSRGSLAMRLSLDHKPSLRQEQERISLLGGMVSDGRVQGMLAVSRSFGDGFFHPYVIADPYVSRTPLCSEDRFLIIACDGVWDVMSDETAVAIVANEIDAQEAAVKLRDTAFDLGSTDNISVVVVFFDGTVGRAHVPADVDEADPADLAPPLMMRAPSSALVMATDTSVDYTLTDAGLPHPALDAAVAAALEADAPKPAASPVVSAATTPQAAGSSPDATPPATTLVPSDAAPAPASIAPASSASPSGPRSPTSSSPPDTPASLSSPASPAASAAALPRARPPSSATASAASQDALGTYVE